MSYRRSSRRAYNNLFSGRNQLVGKRNKYSTLTFADVNQADIASGTQSFFTIVPPTSVQGKRKVKNIQINFSFNNPPNALDVIYWALVFVPSGTTPGGLTVDGSNEFYVPSAFVMASGLYDVSNPGNASRIFTPLSRNLNSGDGIALVFLSPNYAIQAQVFRIVGNYAITLN